MRRNRSFTVYASIAFFIATTCLAADPPPPSAQRGPPPPPEVPINNGILGLVTIALSYGFYSVHKNKKRAA